MKKAVVVLWLFAVVYLGLHIMQFAANEPYRNRMENEAYTSGQITMTYYKIL